VVATGEVTEAAPGDGGSQPPIAPRSGRLGGADATRGLALLGMMAVHILPQIDADRTASTAQLIAGGRSAATFAVLAGVGLALSTGGTHPLGGRSWRERAAAIAVRATAIGAIGLILGDFDAPVLVILPYYALLFLFALPLLRLGPRPLIALAVGAALVVPMLSFLVRAGRQTRPLVNPTFEFLLEDPGGLLGMLLLTGEYPVLAWTTYLCAGLAMGRLALRSTRTAAGLLVVGAAVALAATAASRVLLGPLDGLDRLVRSAASPGGVQELEIALEVGKNGNVPTDSWWWLAVESPHSSTPLDLLHTAGFAAALLGALLLIAGTRPGRWLISPLAAAGSMTLTLYTAHVLLLSGDLLAAYDPWTTYLCHVVGALVFAVSWRAFARRGPLEAAVAALAERAADAAAPRG
jgi:uncharacterized membrane protein